MEPQQYIDKDRLKKEKKKNCPHRKSAMKGELPFSHKKTKHLPFISDVRVSIVYVPRKVWTNYNS